MNLCLFCWLTKFENFWFALKDNLFELGWRLFAGMEKWYEYNGYHRVCVIIAWGIVIYALIITVAYGRRKR